MSESMDDKIDAFMNSKAIVSTSWGTTRQYFGLGTMVAGFFLLGLNLVFPPEDRVFWSACCFLILTIGAWQLDVARKEIDKTQK